MATPRAISRSKLPPLLIQKIYATLAEAKFPTRPVRAKNNWCELVCVDGTTYQLSCDLDKIEKMIVVKDIRVPRRRKVKNSPQKEGENHP